MKIKLLSITLLFLSQHHSDLFGLNGGPMNAEWFYNENNPYNEANDFLQNKNWRRAENEYVKLLADKTGTEYDQNMARLNLASCQMAQEKSSSEWKSFDILIDVPKDKQLPSLDDPSILSSILQCFGFNKKEKLTNKVILVKSNMVGIGDIAHFWQVLPELKKKTGSRIILSVRPFLIDALKERAQEEGIELVSEKAPQPADIDYISHMISLHGHLVLSPEKLSPEKPVFTCADNAVVKVQNQLDPLLAQGNVFVVFEGENRQATLIGGKQLPKTKFFIQEGKVPFDGLIGSSFFKEHMVFFDFKNNLIFIKSY